MLLGEQVILEILTRDLHLKRQTSFWIATATTFFLKKDVFSKRKGTMCRMMSLTLIVQFYVYESGHSVPLAPLL